MAGHKGFESHHKAVVANPAVAVGTSYAFGNIIDRRGTGDLIVLVPFDAVTMSAGTFTAKVQHADLDADGTAPEAGDMTDVLDLDGTVVSQTIDLDGSSPDNIVRIRISGDSQLKAFVRVGVIRVGGSASTADPVLIMQDPVHQSASDEAKFRVAR